MNYLVYLRLKRSHFVLCSWNVLIFDANLCPQLKSGAIAFGVPLSVLFQFDLDSLIFSGSHRDWNRWIWKCVICRKSNVVLQILIWVSLSCFWLYIYIFCEELHSVGSVLTIVFIYISFGRVAFRLFSWIRACCYVFIYITFGRVTFRLSTW